MVYATSGTGQGEIDLNLNKYGFSPEDLHKLEATLRRFKQVKNVRIAEGWLHLEADLNRLTGDQLTDAIAELHARVLQTIQHKSAVATTK